MHSACSGITQSLKRQGSARWIRVQPSRESTCSSTSLGYRHLVSTSQYRNVNSHCYGVARPMQNRYFSIPVASGSATLMKLVRQNKWSRRRKRRGWRHGNGWSLAYDRVRFDKVTAQVMDVDGTGLLFGKRFNIITCGPKWLKLTRIHCWHLWEFFCQNVVDLRHCRIPHSQVVRQLPCCPYRRRRA